MKWALPLVLAGLIALGVWFYAMPKAQAQTTTPGEPPEGTAIATGRSYLDRAEIAGWIVFWSAANGIDPRWGMSIAANEYNGTNSDGTPNPDADGNYTLGDTDSSYGPSYGPMQVLKGGALADFNTAHGTDFGEELNQVGHERDNIRVGIWYLAQAKKATLDDTLHSAAIYYNGGPGAWRDFSNQVDTSAVENATAYADRAVQNYHNFFGGSGVV